MLGSGVVVCDKYSVVGCDASWLVIGLYGYGLFCFAPGMGN